LRQGKGRSLKRKEEKKRKYIKPIRYSFTIYQSGMTLSPGISAVVKRKRKRKKQLRILRGEM